MSDRPCPSPCAPIHARLRHAASPGDAGASCGAIRRRCRSIRCPTIWRPRAPPHRRGGGRAAGGGRRQGARGIQRPPGQHKHRRHQGEMRQQRRQQPAALPPPRRCGRARGRQVVGHRVGGHGRRFAPDETPASPGQAAWRRRAWIGAQGLGHGRSDIDDSPPQGENASGHRPPLTVRPTDQMMWGNLASRHLREEPWRTRRDSNS